MTAKQPLDAFSGMLMQDERILSPRTGVVGESPRKLQGKRRQQSRISDGGKRSPIARSVK